MSSKLLIVFGNQLFPEHPADSVFMAEDDELCRRFRYHKHKLTLVLSAMRSHRDALQPHLNVYYYDLNDRRSYEDKLADAVRKSGARQLLAYEPDSKHLEKRLAEYASQLALPLAYLRSKKFLLSREEVSSSLKGKTLRMHSFYIAQRKRLNILVSGKEPEGGRWSFDRENRMPFPGDIIFPRIPRSKKTRHTEEVSRLVEMTFPDHPGDTGTFFLPTDRPQAIEWMNAFFDERYRQFGPYEDAIHDSEVIAFHSLLSPLLNIGLLLPEEVLSRALEADAPLPSKEGFIRQIIGWREFIRGVYHTRDCRGNFFSHRNRLTESWYTGTTGLPILDDTIRKVVRYGYVHHIERLMVLGNLMLLCEIDPDEVYRWFSELFIDADDWVMVPNVYGMSQYADGGVFATKPYIASSRYLIRMSTYSRGPWCDVIDGLYWRFVSLHRGLLEKNPRMKMMTSWLDKMEAERFNFIVEQAENFISQNTW